MTVTPLAPALTATTVRTPAKWWTRDRPGAAPASADVDGPTKGAGIAWAEDLWDTHGQLAYSMACALLGDETAAMQAVIFGMVDLHGSDVTTSSDDTTAALARSVYRRSMQLAVETPVSTGLPSAMVWLAQLAHAQRAALALCAFGGLGYTDAAELLDLEPPTVAGLLTSGLDDLKRLSEPVVVF